nr:ABC transporter permease [Mangrovicoccus ximenensis]
MIPVIQLLLFGYAIETNLRHIPAALVDQAQSGLSRALVQMVEATQIVDFTAAYATPEEAERAIRAGRVRAALIIPPDLAGRLRETAPPPRAAAIRGRRHRKCPETHGACRGKPLPAKPSCGRRPGATRSGGARVRPSCRSQDAPSGGNASSSAPPPRLRKPP